MLPFPRISQYANTVLPTLTGNFNLINTTGVIRYSFGATYDSGTKLYAFDGYNGSSNLNSFVVYDTSTNVITSLSTGSIAARHGAGLVYWNNKIYMFGGNTGSVTADFYVYDVQANVWAANTTSTNKPSARHHCRFRATDNGILYLWGSDNGAQLFSYNPTTDSWSTLTSSPFANVVLGDMCTDGKDLYCSTGNSSAFMKYTVSTGIWSTLSTGSGIYGRLCYVNGVVHCISGTTLYKFNTQTNQWVTIKTGVPNISSGALLTNKKVSSTIYSLFGSLNGSGTKNIYSIT